MILGPKEQKQKNESNHWPSLTHPHYKVIMITFFFNPSLTYFKHWVELWTQLRYVIIFSSTYGKDDQKFVNF